MRKGSHNDKANRQGDYGVRRGRGKRGVRSGGDDREFKQE